MSKSVFCAALVGLLLVSTAFALEPGDTLWTRTYGGVGLGEYCNQVQQTSDGGFIFAGQSGYQGGIFPWLVKTDDDGDTLWTRVYYEATTNSYFFSVQQTSDGGYAAGGQSRQNWDVSRIDYYLAKTDSAGNTVWTNTYTTPGLRWDYGKSARQTWDGGYIFGGDTAPGPRPYDFYLVRTDASGDTVWTRTYGDTGSYDDRCNSVALTSDGGFVMAGYTNGHGAGGWDFYVVKVDSEGDTLWTGTYGGSSGEEAFCVQETSDRGFIIAGYTSSFGAGNQDFYVVRTDPTGTSIWERTYGGFDHDYAKCVKETPDGGFIIVGSTASFGAGFTDCYIVRTDASGDTLWTRAYGGYDDERAYSVDLTSDGGYIVGGHTSTFGAGDYDAWLLRLAGETPGPDISIEIVPDDPPVTVAQGGSFGYAGTITNNTEDPQTTDIWVMAAGPLEGVYGPFKDFYDFPLNPSQSRSAHFNQRVPRMAPLGFYNYIAYCGDYPSTVMDSSLFQIEVVEGVESGQGGWVLTGSFLEGDLADIPFEFALLGNYPNPFNASTVISYELPTTSHVKLEVYNISGQKLATLVDDEQQAGYRSVTWDASEVSSGVYFYKLSAGDFTETKRMMLVK
jgi:hypothetical protein